MGSALFYAVVSHRLKGVQAKAGVIDELHLDERLPILIDWRFIPSNMREPVSSIPISFGRLRRIPLNSLSIILQEGVNHRICLSIRMRNFRSALKISLLGSSTSTYVMLTTRYQDHRNNDPSRYSFKCK